MKVLWDKLHKEILSCRKCTLFETRTNIVLGSGRLESKIMFIGEAPGANEDKTGKPFCGRAGEILNDLLEKVSIARDDVYIANILKCRPPANRNPKEIEINQCVSYLERQLELINPKIICCLGNFATSYIMNRFGLASKVKGISKIHGELFTTKWNNDTLRVMPMYHPAVVAYNPNMKKVLLKDFCFLQKILQEN